MTTAQLAFSYPRRGLSGEFATFRLGPRAAEKYPSGTLVELVDSKTKKLIARATVTGVHVGELSAMAAQHAHQAHNWKEHPEPQRAELLIASMLKRYKHFGPTRCNQNSIVSVIFLRESASDRDC